MKRSELLKLARVNVKTGKNKYVCTALWDASNANPGNRSKEQRLEGWIRGLLGQCTTLESWLYKKHKMQGCYGMLGDENTAFKNKMRQTRLAWIDWMIQYWESKGD